MQQTDKYKLNLIETGDPLSPAPLNENAEKTEAALEAHTARITALENCRIMVGQYCGTGGLEEQIIDLGERPVAVLAGFYTANIMYSMLAVGDAVLYGVKHKALKIVDNGFWVTDVFNYPYKESYCYMALFGDFPVKNVNYPKVD